MTMFSPGWRVFLYLPNRSTMPARACGTIRIVFASTRMTKTRNSANRMRIAPPIGTPLSFCSGAGPSGPESVDAQHVGRRTLDLYHVNGLADLDAVVLVVGLRGPFLAADLHPAGGAVHQLAQHRRALADQRLGPGLEVRTTVQAAYDVGADQAEQGD